MNAKESAREGGGLVVEAAAVRAQRNVTSLGKIFESSEKTALHSWTQFNRIQRSRAPPEYLGIGIYVDIGK